MFGGGYRVYFGKQGKKIVILLCAGNKATQKKDIILAKKYFEDFKRKEILKWEHLEVIW